MINDIPSITIPERMDAISFEVEVQRQFRYYTPTVMVRERAERAKERLMELSSQSEIALQDGDPALALSLYREALPFATDYQLSSLTDEALEAITQEDIIGLAQMQVDDDIRFVRRVRAALPPRASLSWYDQHEGRYFVSDRIRGENFGAVYQSSEGAQRGWRGAIVCATYPYPEWAMPSHSGDRLYPTKESAMVWCEAELYHLWLETQPAPVGYKEVFNAS